MKEAASPRTGLLSRFPFLLFQAVALLNGLSFALLTPLVLSTDAAASLFQQFAVAVLLATFGDAYANILNRRDLPLACLAQLQRRSWWLLIASIPVGWWMPWVPLTMVYLTLYLSNNMYARDEVKRFAFWPFLISLVTFVVALLLAHGQAMDSARTVILLYAVLFACAMGAMLFLARVSAADADWSGMGGNYLGDLFTSLYSRSFLMIGQNLFIAVSGLLFLPQDVVASRLAFSAQNMLRFLNNLPLIRVSAFRGDADSMVSSILKLVALGSVLMVPAAIAVSIYLDYLGEQPMYAWYEMAFYLAVSVIIVFSPHLVIGRGRSHGVAAVLGVSLAAAACLLGSLLVDPPQLLLAYALLGVACWMALFLGGSRQERGDAQKRTS